MIERHGDQLTTFERRAYIAAFIAAAIGIVALAGWIFDVEVMRRLGPTFSSMKPNTAIAIVLGAAALLLTMQPSAPTPRWVPAALSAVVILIGAATFFEYAAGVDLGIDELLFADDVASRTPGRMSPPTTVAFVLLGSAIAVLRTNVKTAHILATLAFPIGLVASLGYLFEVEGLHTISNYTAISLPTALASVALASAVLTAFPRQGLTAPFANEGTAGVMVRRILPPAVALPIAAGWLIVQGEKAGWWEPRYGTALVVVLLVIAMGLLLWRSGLVLIGVDDARAKAVEDLRQLNVDLEERIEARTFELAESEERFRAVSESAADAIVSANEKGRIEYANAAAGQLFGYDPSALQGMPLTMLMPERFHEAHAAGIQRYVETGIPKLVGTGAIELIGLRSDGTEITIELSLSSWTAKGEVFISGVIRDIAVRVAAEQALRESEVFFRAITENVSDVILRTNPAGVITYASPASTRIVGLGPDEMMGRTTADLFPDDAQDELTRVYASVFGGESGTIVHRTTRADGAEIWIEGVASPVLDEQSAALRSIIWVLRDVSEHQADLEAQREIARREQQLNQLKNEFVGIVAHDLKSPMTVIGGFADILLSGWDETTEEDKLEYLGRIRDNIGRLSTLVDDVLQVSRIEAGDMTMELGPVDLDRLIRRTAEEVVTSYPGRRVDVLISDDLPVVLADEDRQWRVLSNLLSNALKFSEGRAAVEVSARHVGDEVEVTVADHGHGIRPEDLSKLFQRFSRVQQPSGKNVKGTGLGLYITKSLVEAQGGRISVESELEQGTTFRYTVPVTKDDA